MDDDQTRCESCSMPVESGPYCQYCTDEHGNLQAFDERLERMAHWIRTRTPDLSADQAQAQALTFMATMPAWRNHPRVLEHAQKGS